MIPLQEIYELTYDQASAKPLLEDLAKNLTQLGDVQYRIIWLYDDEQQKLLPYLERVISPVKD